MRTAHLTWEEVIERAAGQEIEVSYDGASAKGKCSEEHMDRRFGGCELMQLAKDYFMVTKWPEGKR